MTEPKLPFRLSKEERSSRLFKKLTEYWEERLKIIRTQNDGDRSETETAKLRGRIAELNLNMSLGKETPEMD